MRRPPPGRERRIHVGALWLQLQALLALGMTAVALQRGRTHPGDGVFVLLTAPILWWLGHALGRNSRRVAIGLAVALGLFAFSLVAPVGRTGGKLLFALLQFLFLAPALHAVITSRDPRDPAWHRDYRGEVLLPVAAGVCLGLVLPRSPQRIDSAGGLYIMLLTLALVATLGVLLVRGRLRERVASAVPGLLPKLPQATRPGGRLRLRIAPEFLAALLTGGLGIALLDWFADAAGQPGAMLMVGVLLVPAAGLFGLGVALLWLLTGGARIKGSPKALVLRRIAIAGTLLFTLFALPFLSLLR